MADIVAQLPLKSRLEQLVEHRHGEPVEGLLWGLYVRDGLTQEQVAQALGVNRATVLSWMAKYRIPTRDRRIVAGDGEAA